MRIFISILLMFEITLASNVCNRNPILSSEYFCSQVGVTSCEKRARIAADGTWKPCQLNTVNTCEMSSTSVSCEGSQSSKKGLCLSESTISQYADNFNVSTQKNLIPKLGPKWLCSFGISSIVEQIAHENNIQYVPQIWGRNTLNNKWSTFKNWATNNCAADQKCTVLTFNEPELGTQSNMTVTEAVKAWNDTVNKLKDEGIRDYIELATPCMSSLNAATNWLVPFLNQIDSESYNYHCGHRYVAQTTTDEAVCAMRQWFSDLKDTLPDGKKIIVKEYSWRASGNNAGPQVCGPLCMLDFQKDVQAFFENDARVHSYAQFSPNPSGNFATNFPDESRIFNIAGPDIDITRYGLQYRLNPRMYSFGVFEIEHCPDEGPISIHWLEAGGIQEISDDDCHADIIGTPLLSEQQPGAIVSIDGALLSKWGGARYFKSTSNCKDAKFKVACNLNSRSDQCPYENTLSDNLASCTKCEKMKYIYEIACNICQ